MIECSCSPTAVAVNALVGLLLVAPFAAQAQTLPARGPDEDVSSPALRSRPGLAPDRHLLFNGWGVTPAGTSVKLSDMPLKMVLAPDGRTLALVSSGFNRTGLSLLDTGKGVVTQFVPLPRTFNGLAFSADGQRLFVSGGNAGVIHSFSYADGKVTAELSVQPAPESAGAFLAGLAVAPASGKLYACDEADGEVWVVNPETLKREAVVTVGPHPHTCVFGGDRRHLYVSNWGGRSVSVIDTETNQRVRDLGVGVRPNDMAVAPDGRLFVACAGDNTVYVIRTWSVPEAQLPASPTRRPPEGVGEILSTSLFPLSPEGSTPDAVAVAPDGSALFVANADNNDVMVVDITKPDVSRVAGFIPTGWYPTSLAVSPDSGTLFIGNGKGLSSKPNAAPHQNGADPSFTYIGNMLEGYVSTVPRPNVQTLQHYTAQVHLNCPYSPSLLHSAPLKSGSIIPDQVGAPCPIKHVLYIIKENRTYDQVFGDFRDAHGSRAGNGDESLVMYGENVTPNHHKLAREYVLLDNLYCNSEVSVDGHSWCDAAIATDFNQRSWIMSYSGHGNLPGNFDMGPVAGNLWDLCRRQGVTFRCYGEGGWAVPTENRGTWPGGRDMTRVDGFLSDLDAANKAGGLPQLMIMSLGEDHTVGTTYKQPTPEAAVGSNDNALGRIVAAMSRSKFWGETAIFVIEDDAQNGPDHVDGHRTAGLVISPFVKRGCVDSTLYSTTSFLRTIELILGLPPLTQYDAGATPLFNSFRNAPDLTAYHLAQPRVDLYALNGIAAPGAEASAKMDFSDYDNAPEDELNRILWLAAKGPDIPYPTPVHRSLPSVG